MPTISIFYGITIMMRQRDKEHNPPHIHATYGEYWAVFLIRDGARIEGKFPKRAEAMVKEFIGKNKTQLLEMWESGNFKKLEGLK